MSTFEGLPVTTDSPQTELHDGNYNPAEALRNAYATWMADAECANADPDAFFPDKGGTTEPAKAICNRCDVRQQCLDYAIANTEMYGIWGGLSERERRRIRRMRRHQPDPPSPSTSTSEEDGRRTADRDEQIVAAVDAGVEPARVADRYGITRRSVYRAIARERGHSDREVS